MQGKKIETPLHLPQPSLLGPGIGAGSNRDYHSNLLRDVLLLPTVVRCLETDNSIGSWSPKDLIIVKLRGDLGNGISECSSLRRIGMLGIMRQPDAENG